jgi:magnesium transporter
MTSLEHIGVRALDSGAITLIEYDADNAILAPLTLAQVAELPDSQAVRWINVDGVRDPKVVDVIGDKFGLHPLLREDILSVERPKLEEYDGCIFVVLHMLSVEGKQIESEQISIVLGKSFVLTFQQRVGDVFDDVRARIKNGTGRIRKQRADYLAYRLIDAIVDNYFTALDTMGDLIEAVESAMTDDPTKVAVRELHMLKRETLYLRRAIVPARELVSTLTKLDDVPYVAPTTLVFLRDVYDHLIQVAENLEVQRGILASMTDVYQAAIGNRLNEIMKVMTIVATTFIPLSFLAGLYGMNFENIPELHVKDGYFICLGVMATIAAGMLTFFKRKRWW